MKIKDMEFLIPALRGKSQKNFTVKYGHMRSSSKADEHNYILIIVKTVANLSLIAPKNKFL
jgi:hypothetical protein